MTFVAQMSHGRTFAGSSICSSVRLRSSTQPGSDVRARRGQRSGAIDCARIGPVNPIASAAMSATNGPYAGSGMFAR
jgi:hypothetical protein